MDYVKFLKQECAKKKQPIILKIIFYDQEKTFFISVNIRQYLQNFLNCKFRKINLIGRVCIKEKIHRQE